MKIALFLGAGASTPFGKPTTIQLKNKLLNEGNNSQIFRELLQFNEFIDIEYVLSALKQTIEFSSTLGGHFCKNLVGNFGVYSNEFEDIRKVVENAVFENYSWNHEYDDIVLKILKPLFNLVLEKTDEITVFTTNYDRAVEEFCSDPNNRLRCIDGFYLNPSSGRFIWANGDYGYLGKNDDGKDVFLYKLHGSLNWKKHSKYGIERTTYERKPDDINYEEDFLIYPTLSPKDEVNGKEPYKTILTKFDELMNEVNACIVIGFSFRDEHINEKFLEFANNGKTIIVISPNGTTDFRTRVLKHNPTDDELENWKNSEFQQLLPTKDPEDSVNWRIHFIQKKLEVETAEELVHDIRRILNPEEHPF